MTRTILKTKTGLLEESVIQQTEAATLHGPQGSSKSNIGIDQLSDQVLEGGTLNINGIFVHVLCP
jgi:hypothetical protein